MKFKKHPSNPIYGGPYTTGTLFDVYVTRQPDRTLRMDFSWRPKDATAVAFSSDGVSWSDPLITLSANPESGWETLVNRNCVQKIGEKYKMWYTGQADGKSYIGYAESNNGLIFHRVRKKPVLSPELPWEKESVMNPCVLFENGIYRMWYSAGETYEPNVLAYAESKDGINWERLPLGPILECNPSKEYEQERIGGCQVIPHGKLGYLIFYIGYKDINTACVCCARSDDGVTNVKRCGFNPLVSPGKGEWDADSCYKPSAFYDEGKNEWRIWYNGRCGGAEYIGLASAEGDFKMEDFEC